MSKYKKTGIIIGVVLIVFALLLVGLSKVRIKSTSTKQNLQTETSVSLVNNSINLSEVVDISLLDMSTSSLTSDGVIIDKLIYLQGSQLIYALKIKVSTQEFYYYCTYSVYNSVKKNDKLSVVFQQPTKNSYSIISVTKITN